MKIKPKSESESETIDSGDQSEDTEAKPTNSPGPSENQPISEPESDQSEYDNGF